MVYISIISLLTEKPFYLLRPQSFSFQLVSNTSVKFPNFMSCGWSFYLPVLSWGRVFVHSACPGGRVLPPSSRVLGVEDEIDSRIISRIIKNDETAEFFKSDVFERILFCQFLLLDICFHMYLIPTSFEGDTPKYLTNCLHKCNNSSDTQSPSKGLS